MQLTRRKFLTVVGAGAVVAAAPAGLITAGGQSASAAFTGVGNYAVVSQHATWGIYESMAHAAREAELIRHSGAIMTNAVKCSPEMVQQYQLGKLGSFVEIDGWAVTREEARKRGLKILRSSGNRGAARDQLISHYVKEVCERVTAYDENREDHFLYARADDDEQALVVYNDRESTDKDVNLLRCSQSLAQSISDYQEGHGLQPEISTATVFHMLGEEHEERLEEDVFFRLAVSGQPGRVDVAKLLGPAHASHIAYGQDSRWVLGVGLSAEQAMQSAVCANRYFNDDLVAVAASQTLVRAVMRNGYEIPPFWQLAEGIARHEVELTSI